MKVAVSIPDSIFAEAEQLSRRLKTSRSEIYSRALGEFIGRHSPEQVTQLMNEAVAQAGGAIDDFIAEAARQNLKRVEW